MLCILLYLCHKLKSVVQSSTSESNLQATADVQAIGSGAAARKNDQGRRHEVPNPGCPFWITRPCTHIHNLLSSLGSSFFLSFYLSCPKSAHPAAWTHRRLTAVPLQGMRGDHARRTRGLNEVCTRGSGLYTVTCKGVWTKCEV